jgi:imidazolonepropionase-like amidohydrolase
MIRKSFIAAAIAATSSAALAAPTYIHAGRVIAVPGEAALGPSTVIVDGGRIVEVRSGHIAAPPAGADTINLGGKTVLPGLIDSHVHLDSDAGGNESLLQGLQKSDGWFALNAYANGMKTLRAGFTTVRNLGDGTGATLALRDAVAAGVVEGPRIVDAGRSISATTGHMDSALGLRDEFRPLFEQSGNTCDGAEDCRRAVRLQIARGADVIKFASTGGVNSRIGAGLGAQMFEDEGRAIVETARLYDKAVAVHAHGADGILLALRLGVDSIEHGTILTPEAINAWARSRTYYVPTLSTVNGYLERIASQPIRALMQGEVLKKIQWRIGITGQSLRQLVPRGVKIAFGTDAGVSKHGNNADEFELMVAMA